MSKVRVNSFCLSLDGYGAAPGQSLENPFGVGGMVVTEWFAATKTFHEHVIGQPGKGSTGVDNDVAAAGLEGIGAWILGRNMFGPDRVQWDLNWKGWWGPDPSYHRPVFVLGHHAREPLVMEGGTTFHFITGGILEALECARAAAGDLDVRIGGGTATIRQYLQACLIDEMHLAVSPVVLGAGENLFAGLNLPALGYKVAERKFGENAMHAFIRKAA